MHTTCFSCVHFVVRKNNRPLQVKLENGRSGIQDDFQTRKHIEKLHSTRKQGRRIYNVCICKQCVCLYKHHLRCKILVGNTQTLELHPVDADCAIASLIRSNLSQPYIIAHTPDQDIKCRSGHLHLRKQPLHDSFCTGHCSTLFISS